MFGYSGPIGILNYLVNLVVFVGSATESPLALSGPLSAAVSRGGDCYFFEPCCLPPTLALLLTAHCSVPILCAVWGQLPPQSSSTLVRFGALQLFPDPDLVQP